MNKVKLIAVLATATGIVAAGAVVAKPGKMGGLGLPFEQIDTDGNGELSKAELSAIKDVRFAAADGNGDGKLSLEEMQSHGAERASKRAEKMIERLDADGDGQLSLTELPQRSREGRMFARLDADQSGGISKEEFEEARKHRGHKRRHSSGDTGESEQN